jgi:hypothetical protein
MGSKTVRARSLPAHTAGASRLVGDLDADLVGDLGVEVDVHAGGVDRDDQRVAGAGRNWRRISAVHSAEWTSRPRTVSGRSAG